MTKTLWRRNVRNRLALMGLLFCAGCGPRLASELPLKWDYVTDVDLRGRYLERVAESDEDQYFVYALTSLLEKGGILAFRDYLLYLHTRRPSTREFARSLQLCLGKPRIVVGRYADGRRIPAEWREVNLGCIIDTGPLMRAGLLDESKKYSYGEIAQIIERTMCHWRGPSEKSGYFSHLAGGMVIFIYVKDCPGSIIGPDAACPVETRPVLWKSDEIERKESPD